MIELQFKPYDTLKWQHKLTNTSTFQNRPSNFMTRRWEFSRVVYKQNAILPVKSLPVSLFHRVDMFEVQQRCSDSLSTSCIENFLYTRFQCVGLHSAMTAQSSYTITRGNAPRVCGSKFVNRSCCGVFLTRLCHSFLSPKHPWHQSPEWRSSRGHALSLQPNF